MPALQSFSITSAAIVLDKWLPDDKIPSSQLVNGEVLASNPPVIA
ncbi:MAG: hypothetical protein WBW14_21180 [Candidatus Acidiferrum sp.]|jgi:hypothetical protein